MEKTDNTPETPETPETPKAPAPNRNVTVEITLNGEKKRGEVRFHTPSILECVKKLDDAATVRVIAPGEDAEHPKVLLDAPKAKAVEALTASTVPPEQIGAHVQKLVQFLADHSNLRAISVEAVYVDAEGRDSGFGFVSTTADCTQAQAVSLVNCCDANVDEFLAKTKIIVPGRNQPKGGIVTPTEEQVKALG